MEEIKMKNIDKKDIIIFIITFIITIIIFIPFLKGHYATDTYNIANVGYYNYAINWSLKDGRIFMALIGIIAGRINISINLYVFITLIIALLISNITVLVLSRIIKKYKKTNNIFQDIIVIIISYITIFNFMYLENMYFVESIVMSISVLLFLIAAYLLVEKSKNYIIKSMVFTIIGIICYQGTIGSIFAFTILFSILKNKNNVKNILIDLIKCGIIALISVLLNIVTVKIIVNILKIKQTRLGHVSKILENIEIIILTLPKILQETCNLFPKNMLLMFLAMLTIIVVIYDVKNKNEKNYIFDKYLAIVIITIISSCVTYILTLTSFYTGRLRNSLGALIGIIFIFLYTETTIFEKMSKLKIITFLTLLMFLIINIINYESIIIQHKEVNRLEKEEVQKIETYIKGYEESTGINVTKIVKIPIYNKQDETYFPNTKNKTSFTHNALKTSWAADGVINFYTNRNLKTVKITSEQKKIYLENQDSEVDYQCIEDILYVRIYCF